MAMGYDWSEYFEQEIAAKNAEIEELKRAKMLLARELHEERISSAQVNYELKQTIRDLERRVQSPVLHTIELKVDELDYQAIQTAMALRQSWRCIPDSDEAQANLSGRLVAEICRGWHERVMEDRSDRGREPFQPGDEGL